MKSRFRYLAVAMALLMSFVGTALVSGVQAQDEAEPLKIGALLPFSGDLSDFGPGMFNGAELAVNQINEAGGVNGNPIELFQGDSATAPQQAVEDARRLVEVEGVSAIVGPAGSGTALQVAEAVTGPGGIVQITGSATSPALATANDNDFLFRTTVSDAAQGVILAQIATERGLTSVCSLYVNNAYGQGLSDAFTAAFEDLGGTVTAQIPHEQEQASYSSELSACLEGGPEAIAALGYPESQGVYLREALESGEVSDFLFADGGRSPDLFAELGAENFEGMVGTSAGSLQTGAGEAFDAAYEVAYGELPSLPYLREYYDAVWIIALAAQAAGSSDPAAIQAEIRNVAGPDGTIVTTGAEGWAAAVELLDAGEAIDFEGASGSADFDENGDIGRGVINVWTVQDGEIVDIEQREFVIGGENEMMGTPESEMMDEESTPESA